MPTVMIILNVQTPPVFVSLAVAHSKTAAELQLSHTEFFLILHWNYALFLYIRTTTPMVHLAIFKNSQKQMPL